MTNLRKINKPFNFRLPVAMALSLAAGIVYATMLTYFAVDGVYILIPAVIAAAAFLICTAVYKRVSLSVNIAFITVFFLIGALCVYFIYCAYGVSEVPLNQTCLIEGKVSEVGLTSYDRNYIVISDASAGGIKLDGKIIAYLGDNAGDYCERGYTVTFSSSLAMQSFFYEGEVSYRAINGIKYFCTVNEGLSAKWGFSPFGAVNSAVRDALFDNLDAETASVCFAMLTGDSSLVSEGTLISFRNGGIAHIFAVSGLHIGVIYGAITFVFKKLPVNRYVSAVVRLGIVFFYVGVCGFTPSSVRAAVACTVAVAASLAYKKYDALNSLSVAAIILLLINPLYLFGVGFLLSFGAALGIIVLRRDVSSLLRFMPEKPGNVLAAGLSANVLTIPTQFKYFGYVSWAGLFLNLILLPIVSVFYLLLFVCVMLSAALPFLSSALVPFAAAPIQLLINLIVECGFENAVISKTFGAWIYIPFLLLLVGVSDKFKIKLSRRGALCSLASVGLLFLLVGV